MKFNDFKERLEEVIEEKIQAELRYETDNITHEGWEFLDNKAAILVLEKIEEDIKNEDLNIEDLSSDIHTVTEKYLYEIIRIYEERNPNIRVY